VLRNIKDETLRQQFVYFGKTDKDPLFFEFNEGVLKWITKKDVLNLDMPMTCRYILKHYLLDQSTGSVLEIGVATSVMGKDDICWNEIVDFTIKNK
jgi:hypothetical protein